MFRKTLASFLILLYTTPEAYAVGWNTKVDNIKCQVGVETGDSWTYSDYVTKHIRGGVAPDFAGEFTVGDNTYVWEVIFRNDQANTFVRNKATNVRVALASISIPRGEFPSAPVEMLTLSRVPDFSTVKSSCTKFQSYN